MATLTIADLDNGKRDLETVEAVANSRATTATTRFGQQTTTLYESIRRINATGDEILSNLGFRVPVPYVSGLEITDSRFTVTGPDGKVYAPLSAPFTTGAWDSTQWYVLQNDLNDHKLLVFGTLAAAETAAATLPDGQRVEIEADETREGLVTQYVVESGALVFVRYTDQLRLDLADGDDPTNGASLVARVVARVDTITATSAAGLRDGDVVIAKGRDTVGDGGGGDFTYFSESTQASDGGVVFEPSTGGGRFVRNGWAPSGHSGPVVDKWFGAKGNKSTDDTVAIQRAIDYCTSFSAAIPLIVTGPNLIRSSLIVNRAIDVNQTDFRIIGDGNGGFYADTPITFFTSTLPGNTCSEFITFAGVVFEGITYGLGAYVLTQKFLRIKFLDCTFDRMLCCNFTTTYAQTFRFANCRIRSWEGYFFISQGSYDIDFDGCIIEHGGSLFRSIDVSSNTGSLGNRFRGNVIEGLSGGVIEQSLTRGLDVSGNYTELNKGKFLNLAYDLLPQHGINADGNLIVTHPDNLANADYFEIEWGGASTANSTGNYTTGRLHSNQSMTGPLITNGDVADLVLFKGNGTGITDAARGGSVGTVHGVDKNSKILYVTNGPVWSGIDPNFSAFVVGPGVNNAGILVPVRFMFGSVDPGAYPASYGNPFWAIGSRVLNSNPVVGAPKGWICTASGQPGTWVSEGNL